MKMFKIFSPSLPCGCVLGKHLCQEAEALWFDVNRLYNEYLQGTGTRAAYERALHEYNQHYKGEREELPA